QRGRPRDGPQLLDFRARRPRRPARWRGRGGTRAASIARFGGMEGRVARISIAPVKALHLVNPDEVELGHAGVVGDRRFWLVDADRRLVNGKRHPELMRVHPEWDEGSRRLVLAFPDGSTVDGVVEPGASVAAELYATPHPSRAVPGPWP